MIRKADERITLKAERRFGAPGFITIRQLTNSPEELNLKGRALNHITILPGSGIGYHEHSGDSEIYYILSGQGEYSDNGRIVTVGAGDVTFCPDGEGHSLMAVGEEPLELIALILYE